MKHFHGDYVCIELYTKIKIKFRNHVIFTYLSVEYIYGGSKVHTSKFSPHRGKGERKLTEN